MAEHAKTLDDVNDVNYGMRGEPHKYKCELPFGDDDKVVQWSLKKMDYVAEVTTGATHACFINRKRGLLYELIHEVITPQS